MRNSKNPSIGKSTTITERNHLQTEQALLAAIVNSSEDAIVSKDLDGIITSWNPAAERIYGWKAEEIVGKPKSLVIPPDMPNELAFILERIRAGHRIEHYETRRVRKDGVMIDVAISVSPVKSPEGEIIGAATIIRDITDQRFLEAEQARLAAIVNSSEDAIVSKNLHGIVTSWNPAAERIYGWKAEEIVGKSKALVIPPDMPNELSAILAKVQAGERIEHYETRRLRKDGVTIDVAISVSPVRDSHGRTIGAATIVRDITQQKRTERELQRRQEEVELLNVRLKRAVQETHHRVKNNLQIISAMIDMQSIEYIHQETVPLGELMRLGHHIRTLAIVHDLLTRSLQEDEAEQYISSTSIVGNLLGLLEQTSGGRRIHSDVQEMELLSKQAVTLALVINELVSNALKHSAGEVDVSLRAQGCTAELRVSDSGAGFSQNFDPVTQANLGLELVLGLIESDLKGKIFFENRNEGGASVRAQFPLPETLGNGLPIPAPAVKEPV
ncbi:MAG: sensor signal transduction histidine kinase [Chthonomonadales bacterium]|nr:sensor signal transduction histidine kinase [Chthonomonadales bacterium]